MPQNNILNEMLKDTDYQLNLFTDEEIVALTVRVTFKEQRVGSSKRTKSNDLNFSSFIIQRKKPYVVCIYPVWETFLKVKKTHVFHTDDYRPQYRSKR